MKKRPETTLFMLMSVDGKISTGDTDALDFDKDLPGVAGVAAGLPQYYALEQQTDLHSLNTGRVMAKVGMNDKTDAPDKIPVSFIIIDNKPHLNEKGVEYLSKWLKKLYIVTTNVDHPAYHSENDNVIVIAYEDEISFTELFDDLGSGYGIEKMTVQSGGTLNSILVRENLIDHLSIVVAPVVVGGSGTSTLVDGESLHSIEDLKNIKALSLVESKVLDNSYLHLRYDIV